MQIVVHDYIGNKTSAILLKLVGPMRLTVCVRVCVCVNNSNLPPILHRCEIWRIIGEIQ